MLLKSIAEHLLGPHSEITVVFPQVPEKDADDEVGTFSVPRTALPQGDHFPLPSGESFLRELKAVLTRRPERPLFLFPPWVPSRHLSRDFRALY